MIHETHDPLCWLHPDTVPVVCPCDCCLAARVRADMQEQIDSDRAMEALAMRQVRSQALCEAVEAVKAALTDDDGYVRQSELDDAVAAIEALRGPR